MASFDKVDNHCQARISEEGPRPLLNPSQVSLSQKSQSVPFVLKGNTQCRILQLVRMKNTVSPTEQKFRVPAHETGHDQYVSNQSTPSQMAFLMTSV